MIDLDYARDALAYDVVTGNMRWKVSLGPRSKIGALVGSAHDGYLGNGFTKPWMHCVCRPEPTQAKPLTGCVGHTEEWLNCSRPTFHQI